MQHAGFDLHGIDRDMRAEHALGLTATNREVAVRRNLADLLAVLVVLLELGRLGILARHHLGNELAMLRHLAAHERANLRGIGELLGDDVARTRERILGIRDVLARECGSFGDRITGFPLREDLLGEQLQPTLARDRGARLAARAVRCVEVLELGLRGCGEELLLELGRQLALLLDRGEDGCAARFELDQIRPALFDRADLDLVEPARPLFAIPRDERNGVALVQERDHGRHTRCRQRQPGCKGGHRVKVEGGSGSSVVGHTGAGR